MVTPFGVKDRACSGARLLTARTSLMALSDGFWCKSRALLLLFAENGDQRNVVRSRAGRAFHIRLSLAPMTAHGSAPAAAMAGCSSMGSAAAKLSPPPSG